eukprot:6204250-Pleurochrysis_carterae.AAC.4
MHRNWASAARCAGPHAKYRAVRYGTGSIATGLLLCVLAMSSASPTGTAPQHTTATRNAVPDAISVTHFYARHVAMLSCQLGSVSVKGTPSGGLVAEVFLNSWVAGGTLMLGFDSPGLQVVDSFHAAVQLGSQRSHRPTASSHDGAENHLYQEASLFELVLSSTLPVNNSFVVHLSQQTSEAARNKEDIESGVFNREQRCDLACRGLGAVCAMHGPSTELSPIATYEPPRFCGPRGLCCSADDVSVCGGSGCDEFQCCVLAPGLAHMPEQATCSPLLPSTVDSWNAIAGRNLGSNGTHSVFHFFLVLMGLLLLLSSTLLATGCIGLYLGDQTSCVADMDMQDSRSSSLSLRIARKLLKLAISCASACISSVPSKLSEKCSGQHADSFWRTPQSSMPSFLRCCVRRYERAPKSEMEAFEAGENDDSLGLAQHGFGGPSEDPEGSLRRSRDGSRDGEFSSAEESYIEAAEIDGSRAGSNSSGGSQEGQGAPRTADHDKYVRAAEYVASEVDVEDQPVLEAIEDSISCNGAVPGATAAASKSKIAPPAEIDEFDEVDELARSWMPAATAAATAAEWICTASDGARARESKPSQQQQQQHTWDELETESAVERRIDE